MNPFECGTLAHNAWESRTGESNCDKKEEVKSRKRRQPIEVPTWEDWQDFLKSCGLSKKTNKP